MGGVLKELAQLLRLGFGHGLRRGLPKGELARQVVELGNRSALLVVGGMIFFGAVMMAHGASQTRRVVGDLAVVGPAFFELMIRELGPTLSALLAAVRISAAVAAELAAMKVTEQVDALRLSAGDPYSDLVYPRLLAGLLGIPALCLIGTVASALTASLVASFGYGADGSAFLDPSFIDGGDLAAFVSKVLAFGLLVPLAACRSGLHAQGGPGAVGEATTDGVVTACVLVLVADLTLGAALYFAGFP